MYELTKTEEDALIAAAACGDRDAATRLYHNYEGLIIKESHQPYLKSLGLTEDALSIARLAFFEALHTYDAARGIHFAAYLRRQIHGTIYTQVKKNRRYHSRTIHPDQHITEDHNFWETCEAADQDHQSPEETICQRHLLRQAIHLLTPAEKRLLSLLYLHQLPQTRIAARLRITHQSITKAKHRLLQHLRRILRHDKEKQSASLANA